MSTKDLLQGINLRIDDLIRKLGVIQNGENVCQIHVKELETIINKMEKEIEKRDIDMEKYKDLEEEIRKDKEIKKILFPAYLSLVDKVNAL